MLKISASPFLSEDPEPKSQLPLFSEHHGRGHDGTRSRLPNFQCILASWFYLLISLLGFLLDPLYYISEQAGNFAHNRIRFRSAFAAITRSYLPHIE